MPRRPTVWKWVWVVTATGTTRRTITVTWVKGYCDGVLYSRQYADYSRGDSEFGTIKSGAPILSSAAGLDPTTTTLMFDLSVENGNTLYASVAINGEGMQNLTGETGLNPGGPAGAVPAFSRSLSFYLHGRENCLDGASGAGPDDARSRATANIM